jgi:hypothetical protein
VNVLVRIFLARAIEMLRRESAKAEFRGIELRVLAGHHQSDGDAERGQRMGDGCKLDRLGPGADDQSNIYSIQLSP